MCFYFYFSIFCGRIAPLGALGNMDLILALEVKRKNEATFIPLIIYHAKYKCEHFYSSIILYHGEQWRCNRSGCVVCVREKRIHLNSIIFDRLHLCYPTHIQFSTHRTNSTSFLFFFSNKTFNHLNRYFLFHSCGPIPGGSQRTLWGVGNHAAISVVGLGDAKSDWDDLEKIDGVKENVRIAAAGKHFH